VPIRRLHHVDLAVSDVERSLEFYLGLLGSLGAEEYARYPSYRGTEEVVYLNLGGEPALGLRPADGGEHRYYGVGIEHLAVFVDSREEVDEAYERCIQMGANVHHPPEEDNDEPGYWALFVFDPDGIRVEVAHWPRQTDSADS
jgi:catechol 2,3-dioxygenase-like lactoylglutathione lyase family enzyme